MTREQAAIALQAIAGTPDGATVLNYLVGVFGFSRRSTMGATSDATAFNEGQRSVMVHLGVLLDLVITPTMETPDDRSTDDDDAGFAGYSEPDTDGADG